MATANTNTAKASVKFLSCSEIIRLQEATREARSGPQPWILRKLTVAVVVLIIGWSTYVYIGRVCLRMIRREDPVVGSQGLGSKQYPIQSNATELIMSLPSHLHRDILVPLVHVYLVLRQGPCRRGFLFTSISNIYNDLTPLDRHDSARLCSRPCPKDPSSRSSHLRYTPSTAFRTCQYVLLPTKHTFISPKVPHA